MQSGDQNILDNSLYMHACILARFKVAPGCISVDYFVYHKSREVNSRAGAPHCTGSVGEEVQSGISGGDTHGLCTEVHGATRQETESGFC